MRLIFTLTGLICLIHTSVLAFDLECSNTTDLDWPPIGVVYTCFVKNMNIPKRGFVMGSAKSVKTINEVKALSIKNQTVKFIPKFTVSLAQGLKSLEINLCKLKAVDQRDLAQFPNIRRIALGLNELERLESDLFAVTRNLEFVGLGGSKLKFISPNIFNPLKKLQRGWFGNMGCLDFGGLNSPENIETLKVKLMIYCGGTEELLINEESEYKADINIQRLDACNKNLDVCTKTLAPVLSQVKKLPSRKGAISVVCKISSFDMKFCEVIDFTVVDSSTQIGSIKDESGNLIQPKSFVVQHQSVFFLPTNLAEALPGVKYFEVSASGLFSINPKTFQGLECLESLNLRRNKLFSITGAIFANLNELEKLDLSHNNIETIEAGTDGALSGLKVLNLFGNRLKEIDVKFISIIKSPELLDIRKNPCLSMMFPTSSLEDIENEIGSMCQLVAETFSKTSSKA